MKSRTLTCITTLTLFTALAIPFQLAAQSESGIASLPVEAQAGISAQLAKLTVSDGVAFDYLGWSVAVSGDTVVVGTWLAKIGSNYEQGAAYVFVKPAGGWANLTQTAKLTASDGAALDRLGIAVSVSGNTVVAGEQNATIRRRIAGSWRQSRRGVCVRRAGERLG